MANEIILNVELRERTGTGGARETRRAGRIPGILYGGGKDPVPVSFDSIEILKALNSGKFLAHMVRIDNKGDRQSVIPQDIQLHPVTDQPLHIDLYRVDENQKVKVDIPVQFTGEEVCPGIKKGATLNIVRHTVELLVPAGHIPEFLTADISTLEIGDTVKISSITLPNDAEPTITDRDFTIATIAGRGGPSGGADEEAEGDEEEAED